MSNDPHEEEEYSSTEAFADDVEDLVGGDWEDDESDDDSDSATEED